MSTILGTARPWNFAAISADAGGAGVEVGYRANKTDGSNAGGTGTQNQGFAYGQQHTSPAGETAPHTFAVTPGDFVFVQYNSGTVDTGLGSYGQFGNATPTTDYTDANGYVYPTDCMLATKNMYGVAPTIGRGGLCGVFTDIFGNAIDGSFWFFRRTPVWSVTYAHTSAGGISTYDGVFPLNLIGHSATISGFANANNNGTFTCVSVTATTVVLNNPSAVNQSAVATAIVSDFPNVLFAPDNAAFLSLGINDSILRDNTGSFDVTVTPIGLGSVAQRGDRPIFIRYPVGLACCGQMGDVMQDLVYLVQFFTPLATPGELLKSYVGQLFPHGAQNYGGVAAGSNGQNFPY
jgi:hypothetical protein